MQKLWNRSTGRIFAEAGAFLGKRHVRLMFPADEVVSVYCRATGRTFVKGKDFIHAAGSDVIELADGSAIPYLPPEGLFPDPATVRPYPKASNWDSNAIEGGPGGRYIIFNNWNWFAEHQVEIDYIAEDIDFPAVSCRYPGRLPLARAALASGRRLRITFLGDSITEGYNASRYVGIPPYQPPYAGLVGETLGAFYHDLGVNGSGTQHAINDPDRWRLDRPDLLVIAYGMNDFYSGDTAGYLANLDRIAGIAKSERSDTEIVLVASMSGKDDWKWTPKGSAAKFAAALREHVEQLDESFGFVDQSDIWSHFLERKDFYDLTGNGVNHPNDYGHRILASNLLAELDVNGNYF